MKAFADTPHFTINKTQTGYILSPKFWPRQSKPEDMFQFLADLQAELYVLQGRIATGVPPTDSPL